MYWESLDWIPKLLITEISLEYKVPITPGKYDQAFRYTNIAKESNSLTQMASRPTNQSKQGSNRNNCRTLRYLIHIQTGDLVVR
jgi:hypothetical protein